MRALALSQEFSTLEELFQASAQQAGLSEKLLCVIDSALPCFTAFAVRPHCLDGVVLSCSNSLLAQRCDAAMSYHLHDLLFARHYVNAEVQVQPTCPCRLVDMATLAFNVVSSPTPSAF